MVLAYTGTKGEPVAIPSGAAPTFAADLTELADWFQTGRSFRKVATQAALIAATGMEDNDLAQVDNIDGAWFKYDGALPGWRMYGIPVFDTASARTTAISTPADNMLSIRRDADYLEQYLNGAWRSLAGSAQAVVPTISGTGGTSAVDANTGAVTFSGALTQLDVYVPTASIALLNTAKYLDVTFGYTGSTAGYFTYGLLDGSGAINTATQYLADYVGSNGGAALFDARAIATSWGSMAAVGTRKRHRYNMRAFNLAVSQPTEIVGTLAMNDLVAASRITGTMSLSHEVSSPFTGFRFAFTTAGTISNGLLTIEAHY